VRKFLLACGILSAIVYLAANIIVPTQWDAYNWISQTVSELSAIDAPTRSLWISLVTPYSILLIAFGAGVILSANHHRGLKIAGLLLIVDMAGIMGAHHHRSDDGVAGSACDCSPSTTAGFATGCAMKRLQIGTCFARIFNDSSTA